VIIVLGYDIYIYSGIEFNEIQENSNSVMYLEKIADFEIDRLISIPWNILNKRRNYFEIKFIRKDELN